MLKSTLIRRQSYTCTPNRRQTPTARNRLLFKESEPYLQGNDIRLPLDDPRAVHIKKTLRAQIGDTMRVGIVQGVPGTAVVRHLGDGDVRPCVELEVTSWQDDPMPSERIRLLIALPRPKALRRLLRILPTLGVDQVIFTGAARVERSYWTAKLLFDRDTVEALLIQGMEQSTDTRMPSVLATQSLRAALALVGGATPPHVLTGFFSCTHAALDNQLQQHVPGSREMWVVPHPGAASVLGPEILARQLGSTCTTVASKPRLTVFIGPEGGWQEQELVWLRETSGVEPVSLGQRVMTTTTAVIATTALASRLRALAMQESNRQGERNENSEI